MRENTGNQSKGLNNSAKKIEGEMGETALLMFNILE